MASMTDVVGYAYAAGLRNPAKLAMAVAIAFAESRGNPKAHNTTGRDDSYGLWQINMKAHTTAELGISSADALYDPVTNARAMVKISHSGANWGPWTTYPLLAAAFLPAAATAVSVFLANPSTAGQYAQGAGTAVADATGVGALAQAFTEAVQTPVRAVNWLTEPGTWVRIALFAVGGALIVGGIMIFVRPAAESAGKEALKVLPIGKASKLATVAEGAAAA
jgi:lysozyme-like protein